MAHIKTSKNLDQLSILKPNERNCLYCDKELIGGRSTRKFCDKFCSYTYYNVLNAAANNLIRNINTALYKNRRILQGILDTGRTRAKKHELKKAGYEFKYYTHNKVNKNDNLYFYCYDYGYLALEDGQYLIVKEKNLTN